MRIFNLNKVYNVVCNSESTRSGFRHTAVLHKNGFEIARSKICYQNRTWERFQYESILLQIVGENFKDKDEASFLKVIEKEC